jgi:hypothetical protein
MNFKKLLFSAIIALPTFLSAQVEMPIIEAEKEMSLGTKNCYMVVIPGAKAKDISESWKKYVRRETKAKAEDAANEIKIIGAVNKNISSLPFNIFAKVLETSEGAQLSAWFAEGEIFMSSKTTADKSTAVQKYVHDFAVEAEKNVMNGMIAAETKKAKDLEKAFENVVNDQKKAEGNINNANKEIEKQQAKIKEELANIDKAKASQAAARASADAQQGVVKGMTEKMNGIK